MQKFISLIDCRRLCCKGSYIFTVFSSLQGDIGFRGLPGLPGPPGEGLQGPLVFSPFSHSSSLCTKITHKKYSLSSISVSTSQGHCCVFTQAGSHFLWHATRWSRLSHILWRTTPLLQQKSVLSCVLRAHHWGLIVKGCQFIYLMFLSLCS